MTPDRLDYLVESHLNGVLTDEELTELEGHLLSDPVARDLFWGAARVHAQMYFALQRSGRSESQDVATTARKKTLRPLTALAAGLKSLGRDFAREPVALAVIVLVMISGGVLFWGLSQRGPQQAPVVQQPSESGEPRESARGGSTASGGASNSLVGPDQPRTATTPPGADAPGSPVVARLTGIRDATWGETARIVDSELRAGERLSLKHGLAEIAFNTGARVLLEGPAEFALGNAELGMRNAEGNSGIPHSAFPIPHSNNACSLTLGKLVANVPQQAHGFTVHTPDMTIVDKGTQFGVEVKPIVASPPASSLQPTASSATSVQVFQGLVEVQRPIAQAPKSEIIKAGESITSDPATQPTKVEGNPTGYIRELPTAKPAPPGELVPLATWPKDSPLKPGDIVAVTNLPQKLQLFKIDPNTGKQTELAAGIPYRQAPQDHGMAWCSVAVAPDGNVLVGAKGLGAWDAGLLRIDPRSGQIALVTRGGLLKAGCIVGLDVAADGTIYAAYDPEATVGAGHVLRIDPTTGDVKSLVRFGNVIRGFSFDVGGRELLAGSSRDAKVALLQLTPELKLTLWDYDRSLGFFECLVVDVEGRIFVGTAPLDGERAAPGLVYELARGDRQPAKLLTELPVKPVSMALQGDGILVTGFGGDIKHVYRVAMGTGKITSVSSGGFISEQTLLAVVPGKPAAAAKEVP